MVIPKEAFEETIGGDINNLDIVKIRQLNVEAIKTHSEDYDREWLSKCCEVIQTWLNMFTDDTPVQFDNDSIFYDKESNHICIIFFDSRMGFNPRMDIEYELAMSDEVYPKDLYKVGLPASADEKEYENYYNFVVLQILSLLCVYPFYKITVD